MNILPSVIDSRIGRAQATIKFKSKGNLLLPQAPIEGLVPIDLGGQGRGAET